MSRQIWNEGRVVGKSAYEVYVKQHMSEYPDITPASERQWLASSLAMGASMLLKVPNITTGDEDSHSYVDIYFPSNTMLTSANTIMASFFDGSAIFSGDWATKIIDYGDLISNTSSSSPSGDISATGTVPLKTLSEWNQSKKDKLKDYMKIVDGIIIQPGTWKDSGTTPAKDFEPNLKSYPRLRLHIKGRITTNPLILLTGFTLKSVLSGTSILDGSLDTPSPEDGDFLGPAVYPWVSKVIFSVPSSYIAYFVSSQYKRQLPKGQMDVSVKDSAVIDMKASDPGDYYENVDSDSRIKINVSDYSTLGDGTAVLTTYQKSDIYPAAIYGTFVSSTGDDYLNPLDIVAPGTVKMFGNDANAAKLKHYQDTFPGTFAVKRDNSGQLYTLDSTGKLVSVASVNITTIQGFTNRLSTSTNVAKATVTTAGGKTALNVSLSNDLGTDPVMPMQYQVSADPSTVLTPDTHGNFSWSMLFEALANNLGIDVLEAQLKEFKSHLPNIQSGINGVLNITGTEESKIAGDLSVASGHTAKVGKNYIDFNGLRLYISKTVPTDSDIPDGSIGIGWGFD